MSARLTGRRILVTGAGGGMGRAIVTHFLAEGARLALIDKDQATLSEVSAQGLSPAFAADIASEREVSEAVNAAAQALRGIDGIVNAAGIVSPSNIEEMDSAAFQRVLGVNLLGPYHIIRSALPELRRAGTATVVNIASVSGFVPASNCQAYCASKAGLISLTRVLALDLGPRIRVNALCPGLIQTEMTRAFWQTPEAHEATAAGIGLRRMGTPDEVARAALFLSSEESSFTHGSCLTLDGGWSWQ